MGLDNLRPQAPRTPENTGLPERARWYADQALARSRAAATGMRVAWDVAYGELPEQRLDLYLPAADGSPAPVLVFFHGGAWAHGYKEWNGFMAPAFTRLPALFVSVDYRLVPDHRFPAAREDALAAVRWIASHARDFGGDPGRLYVAGWSAGGTLAALVALDGAVTNVRACFAANSMFDIRASDPAPGNRGWTYRQFLFSKDDDERLASPLRQVHAGAPPFFVSYGSDDFPHVIRTGEAMVTALRAAKVPVLQRVYAGVDHYQANLDMGDPSHDWVRTVRHWLASGKAPE